ncbi:MAG: hypothetical protein CL748_01565 [Chloroflexi bacterium]|nr:hypothetical protein [Chloroflexota bacterium]
MLIPKWSFIYYLVSLSLVISIFILIIILIFPIVETSDSTNNIIYRSTLFDNKDWVPILFAAMSFLLNLNLFLTIPKKINIDRYKKFSIIITTISIYFMFVFSVSTIGVLFVPLIILLTAASVNSFFRK